MNESYKDRLYKEYSGQRQSYRSASLTVAGRFDRPLLTITSSALAISLGLINKDFLVWEHLSTWLFLLAWMSLLYALSAQLFGLSESHKACQKAIALLDEEYRFYFTSDINDSFDIYGYNQTFQSNKHSARTQRMSTQALYSLIVGIGLLIAAIFIHSVC